MAQISLQIPQSGQPFSTEGPKVASDMTTIQTAINGNLDTTNIAPAVLQSAMVNTGGATVKGATNIAASESRTNVAFGTLTTPDQVTGIVLPSNGLLAVWYQATWNSSVALAGQAGIFLGANQVASINSATSTGPSASGATANTANTTVNESLATVATGLYSGAQTSAYTGDLTTGQVVGPGAAPGITNNPGGGPCWIFAAAGAYTVSIQFKATSGSVTALNRKLWAMAFSFA